jgi:hypothetical protein
MNAPLIKANKLAEENPAKLKDRLGDQKGGGVNGSRYKLYSKEIETPTR